MGLEESATVGGYRAPRWMSGLEKFVNPDHSVSGSSKVQIARRIPDADIGMFSENYSNSRDASALDWWPIN